MELSIYRMMPRNWRKRATFGGGGLFLGYPSAMVQNVVNLLVTLPRCAGSCSLVFLPAVAFAETRVHGLVWVDWRVVPLPAPRPERGRSPKLRSAADIVLKRVSCVCLVWGSTWRWMRKNVKWWKHDWFCRSIVITVVISKLKCCRCRRWCSSTTGVYCWCDEGWCIVYLVGWMIVLRRGWWVSQTLVKEPVYVKNCKT